MDGAGGARPALPPDLTFLLSSSRLAKAQSEWHSFSRSLNTLSPQGVSQVPPHAVLCPQCLRWSLLIQCQAGGLAWLRSPSGQDGTRGHSHLPNEHAGHRGDGTWPESHSGALCDARAGFLTQLACPRGECYHLGFWGPLHGGSRWQLLSAQLCLQFVAVEAVLGEGLLVA